jgi:hypothetical protein
MNGRAQFVTPWIVGLRLRKVQKKVSFCQVRQSLEGVRPLMFIIESGKVADGTRGSKQMKEIL